MTEGTFAFPRKSLWHKLMKRSEQRKKDEKVRNTDVAEKALVVPIDSGVCDSGV